MCLSLCNLQYNEYQKLINVIQMIKKSFRKHETRNIELFAQYLKTIKLKR